MKKEKKQKLIKEFEEKIATQKVMVFCSFEGLKTKEIEFLREKLKEKGEELKVIKKTLFSIALKRKNIDFDFLKLKGQLLVAFGKKDVVSLLNLLSRFEKEKQNFKILGSIFQNQFLEKEKILNLAQFESEDNLKRKFLFAISFPSFALVSALKSNLQKLVFVLSKIKVKS
jgi:large subunit ribosomal protein L10